MKRKDKAQILQWRRINIMRKLFDEVKLKREGDFNFIKKELKEIKEELKKCQKE